MTELPDPQLLARLQSVGTGALCDRMLALGLRTRAIAGVRPADPAHARFAGPAFTLRYLPMREDLSTLAALGEPGHPQRASIEAMPAGHVLVMECRGRADTGSLGVILATRLKTRGVAAVVADGGMRDYPEMARLGMPLWSLGPAPPANVTAHYAADSQLAIACGGVTVFPGDILVGDGDGVVVVPRHLPAEIGELS